MTDAHTLRELLGRMDSSTRQAAALLMWAIAGKIGEAPAWVNREAARKRLSELARAAEKDGRPEVSAALREAADAARGGETVSK